MITRTPDPSKFQTRVVLNYTLYKCEYYDGLSWKPVYRPQTFYDDLRLDHKFHPYLGSFDDCVLFCKLFKTLQDIDDYHERVFSRWDAVYNEQQTRKDAARNKTWYSKKI